MLHYKKLTILITMLCTASNLFCQKECEDILKKENGIKLLDYIVQEVNKAFLNEKANFNQWDAFHECYTYWFKKLDDKIKELYAPDARGFSTSSYIQSIEYNRYNQQIEPINLAIEDIRKAQKKRDNIQLRDLLMQLEVHNIMLAASFIKSYNSLPKLNNSLISDKLPENIIDAYKGITNITFNPITFLNAYNKTKSNYKKMYKVEPNPKEILGILLGATGVNPVVVSSKLGDLQTGVSEFINTLEELNYQSNRINVSRKFWQSKPKYLLNNSQIMDIENIIKALYTIYPNIMTPFLQKRIEASKTNYYKLQLILFAEAKALMNILQQKITKINSMLQKK